MQHCLEWKLLRWWEATVDGGQVCTKDHRQQSSIRLPYLPYLHRQVQNQSFLHHERSHPPYKWTVCLPLNLTALLPLHDGECCCSRYCRHMLLSFHTVCAILLHFISVFFFLFLFACYFILFIYCVLFYFYSNFITLLGPELSIYFWVTIKNIWTLKRIVDSDFPPSAPHSAREKRGRIKVDICCRIPTAVPQQCGENAVEARSSPLTQDPHQSRNNCLWGGVRCLLSLEIFKFFVRKQVKFLRELIPPYCPHSSYAPRSALRMLRLTHRIHLSHTNPVFYR